MLLSNVKVDNSTSIDDEIFYSEEIINNVLLKNSASLFEKHKQLFVGDLNIKIKRWNK